MHAWPKKILHLSLMTISLLTLVNCQLYRNNSRELFERNAPTKIVNSDIGSKSIQIHECWIQQSTDPLPLLPQEQFPNQYFYTQKNNLDGLNQEVCLAENIPDDSASSFE